MDRAESKVLGSGGAGVMRVGEAGANLVVRPSTRRCAPAQGEETSPAATAHHEGARVDGRTLRRKFTEEIWAKALPEYFGGASAREVCAKYGMSLQTLYLRVGANGKRSEERRKKAEPAPEAAAPANDRWGLLLVAWIFVKAARMLIGLACSRDKTQTDADGRRIRTRRHFSKEIWQAARHDYEVGGFAVPVVAERYGMTEHAVKGRAGREKWCKTVSEAPAPLLPPPDPAQVEEDGSSAWARIAHEAQRAPEGAWSTWLFQGGRGAGKTRAGAEWLAARAEATPNGRFALVGPTQHDVREVMIDGPSGLRSLAGRERPSYESSRRKLKWKNGAVAYAFSAEEPERLRGPQFMAAWADEFCAWPKPDHTMAMLRMGLRLGSDPRLVVTTTPKPVASLRRLREEVSCVVTQAASVVNAANLSAGFLSGLEAIYGGTRLARQELEGVLVPGDGALWRREEIRKARGARPERFDRVVVGVDPPAGSAADGSACGIVVAGRLGKQGFVLEDASVAGQSPLGWAMRVAEMVDKHGAVKVIAEANQGGEMVRTTLAAAGVKCRIELVHARHAKRARAEPIAALYEQGKVTHCGDFPQLEEEMMALGGAEESSGEIGGQARGQAKLDRADALVWALTALLVVKQPMRPGIIVL